MSKEDAATTKKEEKRTRLSPREAIAHMSKNNALVENSATGELCRTINYRGVPNDGVEMKIGVDLSRCTVKDFLSVISAQPLFAAASDAKWPE